VERTNVLFSWKFLPKGSKKLGLVNHIKRKKSFKIKAWPKAIEPWMGDHNHPSIIG
jgi:hypothetical protein